MLTRSNLLLNITKIASFGLVLQLGFQTSAKNALPQNLSNSAWQLVEIQSMEDSQTPKRPVDRSKYTLQLSIDGKAKLKLDCNHYNGNWSAQAGSESQNGTFTFGPLAGTRMHCPAPSFEPLISSQSKDIRSYLIKEGRLYLSLKADGGIWVWEPIGQFNHLKKPQLEKAIIQAKPTILNAKVSSGKTRYIYNQVDLNADGKPETLVYLLGPDFCGTGGCSLMVLNHQAQVIGDLPLVSLPVTVSDSTSKGWKNLSWVQTGGGAPQTNVLYRFNGKKYAKAPYRAYDSHGIAYLKGFKSFEEAAELQLDM